MAVEVLCDIEVMIDSEGVRTYTSIASYTNVYEGVIVRCKGVRGCQALEMLASGMPEAQ